MPNILNTLYRTVTVGGIRAIDSAKSRADFCFEPPVSSFGVFEWSCIDRVIDVGYRYALRKLEEAPGHSAHLAKMPLLPPAKPYPSR
jgi:hypothetical protein